MLAAGLEPSPREWQEAVGLWACFEGGTRAPADSGAGGVYSSHWRPGLQLVQCTPSGPFVSGGLLGKVPACRGKRGRPAGLLVPASAPQRELKPLFKGTALAEPASRQVCYQSVPPRVLSAPCRGPRRVLSTSA